MKSHMKKKIPFFILIFFSFNFIPKLRNPYFYLIVRLVCKIVCFVRYLLCFAAFSLIDLYKRSRVQIPNGPASNLKLTLCQPDSCLVYFSKQGGLNSTMAQMAHFSFPYYFTIPNSEFRVPNFALRISEFGIVKYI